MPFSEAPPLTNRVVVLLMLAVFALCLCADRLQCQNNGWQSVCIGKPAYRCSSEWCRSYVRTQKSLSFSSSCAGKGDAVVLIAVVEVGPSAVSQRGINISEYMVEELRRQMETGHFQHAVRQSVAGHHLILGDDGNDTRTSLTKMFRAKEELRVIVDIPRRRTRYMAVSDAVPLPMVDGLGDYHYVTWEEAVNVALPVSKVDDASQLPRYFPNLYAKLASLSNGRAASLAPSASKECDALVVVVCTVLHPLASVRSVWQTPWNTEKGLSMGHDYVRGAVTRYLMTCRKALRYVHEVQYFQVDSRLPALAFAAVARKGRHEEPIGNSAAEVSARMVAKLADASLVEAFCTAVNVTAPSSSPPHLCRQACQIYTRIGSDLVSGDQSLLDSSAWGRGISSPVRHNCYYEVLAAQGKGSASGTFSTHTLSRVFDDCLRLSPDGARDYANCLLRG
ncbi:hypothetical protein LSCM1_04052 [Leishmania martiniquensis]|uniref:Uncharacterized protein n=1 Tax=Leishmania martiniquensis TaxID=1580590 RepID=A0A836HGD0_9TRYP|nr:hypothetical protein LSCM1_04052 [Leishmania martiniquensis]